MKTIIIAAAYYYPMVTPRAFRATELAECLVRKGYKVYVVNATKVNDFDYAEYSKNTGVHIINSSIFSIDGTALSSMSISSEFLLKLKNIFFYFTTGKALKFLSLYKDFKIDDNQIDLLISIGLPFHIHWATANFIKRSKLNIATKIADYGDPFSFNPSISVAPYFRVLERRVLKSYDYITIPIEEAKCADELLDVKSKLRIIPQGFNFTSVKLSNYTPNKIITFAFAGKFYHDIRNPEFILKYLSSLNINFKFVIYTESDTAISQILSLYKSKLGDKLEINSYINRDLLLYKLSAVDFLINIENMYDTQAPSKLIDYGLVERPIFNCSQNNFDEDSFLRYLSRDFSDFLKIDIDKYNIDNIADKFINLR